MRGIDDTNCTLFFQPAIRACGTEDLSIQQTSDRKHEPDLATSAIKETARKAKENRRKR